MLRLPEDTPAIIRVLYLYYRTHGRWPGADQLRSYGFHHGGQSADQIDQALATGLADASIHQIDQPQGKPPNPQYRPTELRAEALLLPKSKHSPTPQDNAAVEIVYRYRRARGIWPHPDDLRTFMAIHHWSMTPGFNADFQRALAGGLLRIDGQRHVELQLTPHPVERGRLSARPAPSGVGARKKKKKKKRRRRAAVVVSTPKIDPSRVIRDRVERALQNHQTRIQVLQSKSDPLRIAHDIPHMSRKSPAPAWHRCHYCLSSYDPAVNPTTRDHIVPQAIGGGWFWWNLAPACRKCNTKKGDRLRKSHCTYCRRAQELHGIQP